MLEVRNLSKRFGGLKAMSEVSFTVARGEFVGVIGPNGAGKTTLLNLITGYLQPTGGEILFDDAPIHTSRPYQICHRGIGRTFQVVRPFAEMSVLDNVTVGALFSSRHRTSVEEGRLAAQRPLELTGLWRKRDYPASALSIGEKKKLELARALATDPRLLLLDEVLAGLTRAEVDEMVEVLRRINQAGVTIVMIEHLVHVIMNLCQRVVVLNFGQLVFVGETGEAMTHPEVVSSYLGSPLDEALT
ncbi:MAG: branched-chain amino acid transport protein ATP-binding protein [Caballeronia sp.]|jgi:branched-chain amino acid transport system ATP-binding protein|uniref:ABC transporter ATP-binding protein n=1 Tax=Caballeronia sp. TaxID=1931223 RepID=UPI00262345D3|nr:ABC transporter ATP-binding protein [Caballeronia sp.]MDB5837687.1 branched-chain amino acid transport protein ATP-binding protein [Caballeronia sp.]